MRMAKAPDLFDIRSSFLQGYTAKDIEVLEGLEPVRRRPGMYIGGTDTYALHHLAAEILDNSMDEAVAGHATRIEIELAARRCAEDARQRPRHSGRSASEIQEQVGAGSDHDHPARRRKVRRQGLRHLRRPAWRRRIRGERALRMDGGGSRARPARLAHAFRARQAGRQAEGSGHRRTAAAPPSRSSPTRRFSARTTHFSPATLYRMARSKAYLFRGVEIRWSCDPSLLKAKAHDAGRGHAEISRRIARFPEERNCRQGNGDARILRAQRRRAQEATAAGGMGGRLGADGGAVRALLLQHHSHLAGRHARAGLSQCADQGRCARMASARTIARHR